MTHRRSRNRSLDLDTGNITWVYENIVRENWFDDSHTRDPYWRIFSNSSLNPEDVYNAQHLDHHKNEIQEQINSFTKGITAYNKAFDFTFLKDRGISIPKELPCPMKVATPITKLPSRWYGDYKWPSVEEAWDHFVGSHYIEEHRALDDAIHEAQIVYELYKSGHFKV